MFKSGQISSPVRDSNMELLRIPAMLLVLVVHADFMALHLPTVTELHLTPLSSFLRIFIGAISTVCVNIFVLISGWYGIKLKASSLAKIIFQTFFFCILMYLCFGTDFSFNAIFHECKDIFLLRHYWFLRAYILLMLMAPIMNTFAEHASKQEFKWIIIGYFVFQTLFSYFGNDVWYHDGYSPLLFFGIYLLGRYMRLYTPAWTSLQYKWNISIFLLVNLLITIISISFLHWGLGGGRMFNYTSPLVIIASIFLFLFFTKLDIKNSFVNWIAKSCFAVYLLHANPHFIDKWFVEVISRWWETASGWQFLWYVSIYCLSIFAVAILIDKVQMRLFNLMLRRQK